MADVSKLIKALKDTAVAQYGKGAPYREALASALKGDMSGVNQALSQSELTPADFAGFVGGIKGVGQLPMGLQTIEIQKLGTPATFTPKSLDFIESLKKELLTDKKMMPIELNTLGEIIDGAHRHKALLDLGIKNVPVYVGNQAGSSGKLLEPYNGIRVDLPIQ